VVTRERRWDGDRRGAAPGDIRPIPDPTILTGALVSEATDQMRRELAAAVAVLQAELRTRDQRFEGMDKAVVILREDVNRVPTILQIEIGHLKELQTTHTADLKELVKEIIAREVKGIGDQITGRDTALAAALKAAQDAVAQQNTANGLAIDKAQAATKEAQTAANELFRTRSDQLSAGVDDLRSRLDRLEAGGIGATAAKVEVREDRAGTQHLASLIVGIVGGVVGVLGLLFAIVEGLARAQPAP